MPKLRDKQRISLFLPAHIADKAKAAAKREQRSLSNFVRKLIVAEVAPQPEQLELPLEGGQ